MPEQPKDPRCDYTIGIDTIEKMVEKLKEKPWPIYKIKLGTDRDIEIVEQLRKHTDSVLRIDANSAWKAEEALEKINENDFYTTKGTASESGTGLGLMLCKEFLSRNGGQMHIESKVGEGSIFSFTLPKPE